MFLSALIFNIPNILKSLNPFYFPFPMYGKTNKKWCKYGVKYEETYSQVKVIGNKKPYNQLNYRV